jgi:hypothetical protein
MFVDCPHCNTTIEIIQLNCRIFRCGILKSNGEQIDPHLPKNQCDVLTNRNEIYGCGKPFKVETQADGSLVCHICDYI